MENFYNLIDKVLISKKVLVGDNFNSHVGGDLGSFGEVTEGHEIGQINNGGIRLLHWSVGKRLRLMNTCFQKRKCRITTLRSGEIGTMIDYIIVKK